MKRIFLYSAFLTLLASCTKDAVTVNNTAERQPITAAGVNAFPLNDGFEFEVNTSIWNTCTNEPVLISGTFRLFIRGMASDSKVTFILHTNYSGIKGVGLYTGTEYVSTGTFTYINNDNPGDQILWQQNQVLKFVALAGAEGSFTTINDWHLTVNANGEEPRFISTFGDVTTCK